MKEQFQCDFEIEKETKNTIRYKEVSEPAKIGTIYIQKLALPGKPKKITVMISVEE